MTASPEQLAAAADPLASAQTLADLAYAEPALWPAIAAHPNVYADLLEWMRANAPAVAGQSSSVTPQETDEIADRLASSPAILDHEHGGAVHPPAATAADARTPIWRRMTPRARRRSIAAASAVAATALIVTLLVTFVLVPQQQASAAAEQAHRDAVTGFSAAKRDCLSANGDLEGGIARAQKTLGTDPTTLDDPSLIDQLKSAISTASTTTHCSAPRQADLTAAIRKQADSLTVAIASVRRAASDITNASAVVDASVSKKAQAAADAAAASKATADAAAAAQRTWHFTPPDGYSFDMTILVGAPTTSGTLGSYSTPAGCTTLTSCTTKTVKVGEGCSNFDAKTMIAIPVIATITARTQNFDTRVGASLRVATSGSYQGPNDLSYDFLKNYVEEEAVYSNGPSCATGSYAGPSFGVSFPAALKVGQGVSFNFDVIVEKWTSPNAPGGDTALLDWLTIAPGPTTPQDSSVTYSADSFKSINLRGNVIGG